MTRLSSRDRAIMEGNLALLQGDISAVPSVREITRRYPDDPDAWFLLSEFYFHYWDDLQLDWEDLGRVFERPVELEPGFAPYYIHMFEYAVIHRDTATAMRALEGLEPLNARRQQALELVYALILGDSTQQAEAAAAVPDFGDDVLEDAYVDLWLTAGRPSGTGADLPGAPTAAASGGRQPGVAVHDGWEGQRGARGDARTGRRLVRDVGPIRRRSNAQAVAAGNSRTVVCWATPVARRPRRRSIVLWSWERTTPRTERKSSSRAFSARFAQMQAGPPPMARYNLPGC